MKESSKQMKWNKWTLFSVVLFLFAVVFEQDSPYLLLLTVAQVIYIHLTLQMIVKKNDWFNRYYSYFAIPAFIAVILLHMTNQSEWDYLFAAIYLLFTF